MRGDRRDLQPLEGKGAGFGSLVGQGDAGLPAQVSGPPGHDEEFPVASGSAEIGRHLSQQQTDAFDDGVPKRLLRTIVKALLEAR